MTDGTPKNIVDTELVALPLALTPTFSRGENKVRQWQAFVRKLRLERAPAALEVVVVGFVAMTVFLALRFINKHGWSVAHAFEGIAIAAVAVVTAVALQGMAVLLFVRIIEAYRRWRKLR